MVDEAVVVDRLELINQYTNECEEMRDVSRTEYLGDFVLQRAVERSLMNAIQSRIDLASRIRATEDLETAETSREEIEAFVEAGLMLQTRVRSCPKRSAFETISRIVTAPSTTTLCTTCYRRSSNGSITSNKRLRRGFETGHRRRALRSRLTGQPK
jgi:hypothetical protein